MKLDIFQYNGRHYLRCTPAKSLCQSTMVYEVLTRGDQFAVELATGKLTIIKGGEVVVDKPECIVQEPKNPGAIIYYDLRDTRQQEQLFGN